MLFRKCQQTFPGFRVAGGQFRPFGPPSTIRATTYARHRSTGASGSRVADCFRRVSPVAPRPREGPLTEPTAGAQPWPRERVLMPQRRLRWIRLLPSRDRENAGSRRVSTRSRSPRRAWPDPSPIGGYSSSASGKSYLLRSGSDQPAPRKPVPALCVRRVDVAKLSAHSVREVRGRCHLSLQERRRGAGAMERVAGSLHGLQAGAAP
jgi:hypothetical protein